MAALWAGVLTGPLAWAAVLEANYALSYVACEHRHTWMLHLVTIVGVALACGAGYAAWSVMPATRDEAEPSIDPDETTHLVQRFMGISAIAISAWFVITILSMEVPILVLGPCR